MNTALFKPAATSPHEGRCGGLSPRGGYRPLIFWLLGAALFALLSACAPTRQPQGTLVPPADAVAAWNAYDVYASDREAENGPYRINASLRFGEKGDTRRVVVLMWSNGERPQAPRAGTGGPRGEDPSVYGPIRLDVTAGFSTLVARLREGEDGFVAFSPRENKAMVYKGGGRVRLNIGTPVPFGLRDFSGLLRGRFHEVFGPAQGTDPVFTAKGNLVYTLSGGDRPGTLELRPDGLPVRWEENGGTGWSMSIDYEAEDGEVILRPHKISLVHPEGRSAILLVKSREKPARGFTADQLALTLPPGVEVEAVRAGRR